MFQGDKITIWHKNQDNSASTFIMNKESSNKATKTFQINKMLPIHK